MDKKSFMKFDNGKPRYSLIPVESMDALVSVLEYGAAKYKENNWKKCKDPIRYYDAALRHLQAWRKGEVNDKESGLSHLNHAFCNLMFLSYLERS